MTDDEKPDDTTIDPVPVLVDATAKLDAMLAVQQEQLKETKLLRQDVESIAASMDEAGIVPRTNGGETA